MGEYTLVEPTVYSSCYIGGGANDKNSNMTVYMDGCTLEVPGWAGEGWGWAMVFRGGDGEHDNTVNISNTRIVYGTDAVTTGRIRIDAYGNDMYLNNRLNVGTGMDITLDDVSTANTDTVAFTGQFYRRSSPDKVLDGRDFEAMRMAMETRMPEQTAEEWTFELESGETVTKKVVLHA